MDTRADLDSQRMRELKIAAGKVKMEVGNVTDSLVHNKSLLDECSCNMAEITEKLRAEIQHHVDPEDRLYSEKKTAIRNAMTHLHSAVAYIGLLKNLP